MSSLDALNQRGFAKTAELAIVRASSSISWMKLINSYSIALILLGAGVLDFSFADRSSASSRAQT